MIDELKPDAQTRRKLTRVLIVEDEPTSRDAVRLFLEFRGHDVVVASSAEEAFAQAGRFNPLILVCDWKLDGGPDGVDVADNLQRRYNLAVIMMTAHRLDALKEKARESAVNVSAYRRKPVSLAALAEVIESLSRLH